MTFTKYIHTHYQQGFILTKEQISYSWRSEAEILSLWRRKTWNKYYAFEMKREGYCFYSQGCSQRGELGGDMLTRSLTCYKPHRITLKTEVKQTIYTAED